MQIETLKMFCDVVDTGSFSIAARLNHVTQSAVSQQIRALEERYAQKLLSRSARAAVPTAAGSRLYRASKELLLTFGGLEAGMREQAHEVGGEVTLATIYSVGLYELSPYLKSLLKRFPKVTLRLSYRRSADVVEDVLSGSAHLGIVAYPTARPGLTVLPLKSDDLVLVCARSHPLSRKRRVLLADLEGERFIGFDRDIPTGKAVDGILRDAGVNVNVTMEMDNVETIKQAVELGLGVSILPRATVLGDEKRGALLTRALADGEFTRPIGLLLKKGRFLDRAASAVVEVLSGGVGAPELER